MDANPINEIADEVVQSVFAKKLPQVTVYDKRNRPVGDYKFLLYVGENERPHVHVKDTNGNVAKFWIDDCSFNRAGSHGFNPSEKAEIQHLVQLNREILLREWNRIEALRKNEKV